MLSASTGLTRWADPVDGLARLPATIAAVEAATGIAPLPDDPTATVFSGVHQRRLETAWAYLETLGYPVARGAGLGPESPPFQAALRAFQADAGLKVDGWMGAATWDALRQLVTFEEPVRWPEWWDAEADAPLPHRAAALLRGAQARLVVLGCRSNVPNGNPSDDDEGRLRRALGIFRADAISSDAFSWLQRLFDHDALLRVLAESNIPVRHAGPDGKRFAARVVWAELWMAGLPVGSPEGAESQPAFWAVVRKVRTALPGPQPFGPRWVQLDRTLLGALVELGVAEPTAEAAPTVDALLERVDLAELDRAWVESTQGGKHAFRLWDGLQRAWAWIRGVVQGIGSFLKRVGQALAGLVNGVGHVVRALYERASAAVTRVCEGLSALVRWVSGPLHSEPEGRYVVHLALDGDVTMWAQQPDDFAAAANDLRGHVDRLGDAWRFLSGLLGLLVGVVTGNWLQVIRVLAGAAMGELEPDDTLALLRDPTVGRTPHRRAFTEV